MPEPIDILENRLLAEDPDLLRTLLTDRTTAQPILWATDSYAELGTGYHAHDPITPEAITGERGTLIMPRVAKSAEEQHRRAKQMAEVFTPARLVNRMCNALDEEWFGRTRVFNTPHPDGSWTPTEGPIPLPEGRTLEEYLLSPRLEITCGEAPFLVSRYDTVTGDVIPLTHRIGLLDRKLRLLSEHCPRPDAWIRLALLALGSVYGYEWQGDNLLIAREALLATFSDYYADYHHADPSRQLRLQAAEIISWNLWQMDGIKGVVPGSCHETTVLSAPDLFGERTTSTRPCLGCATGDPLRHNGIRCRLRRWLPSDEEEPDPLDLNYTEILTKQYKIYNHKRIPMKFDFVIGNPPYQEETDSESTRKPPVYNYFMDASYLVSNACMLITPARFLFNTGYTPKQWNKKMLESQHFKVCRYYPKGSEVFPSTDIKGGVVVTYHDRGKAFEPIGVFTQYELLNEILHKVRAKDKSSLSESVNPPLSYDVSDVMKKEHPELIDRLRTSAFVKLGPIFYDTKPKCDKSKYIAMLGLQEAKRIIKYVRRDYILDKTKTLGKWRVLLPESNGSGELGETLSNPQIAKPNLAHTQTFLSIGAFESKREAEAACKYIKTKFCRAMLGVLKITQHNPAKTWKFVPLQDFSSESDIDWSRSVAEIDRQLYDKYGLTEEEIDFIETHVKEMA